MSLEALTGADDHAHFRNRRQRRNPHGYCTCQRLSIVVVRQARTSAATPFWLGFVTWAVTLETRTVSETASVTFTIKFVTSAKPRRNAAGAPIYTEYKDVISPLRLAVQESGHKSAIVRYRRPDGRPAKLTFKDIPLTSLAVLRQAAAAAFVQLEQGNDPSPPRTATQLAPPLQDDSIERWVADFIELHARRKTRASTATKTEQQLRRLVLPAWRGRAVQSIRRRDVIELIEHIAVDRPYLANRLHASLSKLFNWLCSRDVIPASPVVGVERPHKEQARDRVLTDTELIALWRACEGDSPAGQALRLLFLTGTRLTEVSDMRWSELSTDGDLWQLLPLRTKNGKAHALPLASQARHIVAAMPVIDDSDFVFTINGRNSINGNWGKAKKRISIRAGIDPASWRLHDTRRTCASGMQRLGIRVEVIERALNHVSGVYRGVAGVYQRDPLADEVRSAFQRWADHVEALVTGKPAKVVKLQAKR
jgi:integrase